MQYVLLLVAVFVFAAIHQFYLGWDGKSLASNLSFSLLEVALIVPLIDALVKGKERRELRAMREQYVNQAVADIHLQLYDDVSSFFHDLVEDLDRQFSIRRAGRGAVVTQTDWETIFSAHLEGLERIWKLSDRLSAVYVPLMVAERDADRFGRTAWLNALLWKLGHDMSWHDELDNDIGDRLTKDQKEVLRRIVTTLTEMGQWLKDGINIEGGDTDVGIQRLKEKFRYLVTDEGSIEFLETVETYP